MTTSDVATITIGVTSTTKVTIYSITLMEPSSSTNTNDITTITTSDVATITTGITSATKVIISSKTSTEMMEPSSTAIASDSDFWSGGWCDFVYLHCIADYLSDVVSEEEEKGEHF